MDRDRKCWWWRWTKEARDEFREKEIKRARKTLLNDDTLSDTAVKYFNKIIDIIEKEKYARIKFKDGAFIDVARVAGTHNCASFFDILNHSNWVDYDVEPEETDSLEHIYRYYLLRKFKS